MEPMELLQWVAIGLVLPGLTLIGTALFKVRQAQTAILNSLMEMHKWHAPQMHSAIQLLIEEIKGLRSDFRDVIPKLQDEHVQQDKDVALLTTQVSEIRNLLSKKD